MLNCKYKTRGQSSAQGKPRVYFCCHHDDFEEYFDSISDSILKISDCAIYYRDGEESASFLSAEDMSAVFSQIKLFVIPVTRKFLSEPNSAREAEFKFATEHHIPVLPLLQEAGIEHDFNKYCGDLHLIDQDASRNMFSGYEEQLAKFIKRVLLDDTLTQKIRMAFDAYIFLSYRKKDREAAHQLMRLIHQNEFCRDVAIWYDEFLVPGENFNDGIHDALIKSRLFALAVTPHLLEEDNYVMKIEFPMAKGANKPILAVKLEQTDSEQMARYYDGLDCLVDAAETQRIAEALKKALLDEAGDSPAPVHDDDAEHLFLIGLAYLCGIDVEKDAERAVSLIERASDAGLDEAKQKLVDMYLLGDGVKRDTRRAYQLQSELLSSKARAYGDSPSESNALSFADAITETAEIARISRSLSTYGIKSMLKKQVKKLKHITDDVGEWTNALQYKTALIYGLLAQMSCRDSTEEAEDYTWHAYEYLSELAESGKDPEHIAAFFVVCTYLGQIDFEKGDETEGVEWLTLCESALQTQLQKFPDNNSLEWAYILALVALGEYYLSKQRYGSAREMSQKALDVAKRLYEKAYSEQVQDRIVHILCNLASIALNMEERERAIGYATEALSLQGKQKRLASKLKLCDCHRVLASCYSADGQHERAREQLELAYRCLESEECRFSSLTEGFFAVYHRLTHVCLELSAVCEALGDFSGAYRYDQQYEQMKKAHDELSEFFSEDDDE